VAMSASVFLATALPVSIGGFGTREAAIAGYFALAGLDSGAAVAGALLHGLSVTVQGLLWAPLFLVDHRDKLAH
jgi:glycosyltransferase 2 family protein